jgi:hypothetical protein
MVDRDRLLAKARKTKKVEDWNAYKRLRNKCNNKLKLAKSTFQRNLLNENVTNPRKFWKVIKKIFPLRNLPQNSNTCVNEENQIRLVENFSSFYSTAVRSLKEKSIKLMDFVWRLPKSMVLRTTRHFELRFISSSFVQRELKKLKRQKAQGTDELPPGLLKDCRQHIFQPLGHILNLSIQCNKVPSLWKVAKVVPIHKKGS